MFLTSNRYVSTALPRFSLYQNKIPIYEFKTDDKIVTSKKLDDHSIFRSNAQIFTENTVESCSGLAIEIRWQYWNITYWSVKFKILGCSTKNNKILKLPMDIVYYLSEKTIVFKDILCVTTKKLNSQNPSVGGRLKAMWCSVHKSISDNFMYVNQKSTTINT